MWNHKVHENTKLVHEREASEVMSSRIRPTKPLSVGIFNSSIQSVPVDVENVSKKEKIFMKADLRKSQQELAEMKNTTIGIRNSVDE